MYGIFDKLFFCLFAKYDFHLWSGSILTFLSTSLSVDVHTNQAFIPHYKTSTGLITPTEQTRQ